MNIKDNNYMNGQSPMSKAYPILTFFYSHQNIDFTMQKKKTKQMKISFHSRIAGNDKC